MQACLGNLVINLHDLRHNMLSGSESNQTSNYKGDDELCAVMGEKNQYGKVMLLAFLGKLFSDGDLAEWQECQ